MNTAELKQNVQKKYGRAIERLHNGLALIGFMAVVLAVAQGSQWLLYGPSSTASSMGPIRYAGESLFGLADDTSGMRNKTLAGFLARRYRVANDATELMVEAAQEAGQAVGLDPVLILSVVAIESRFNPIAESVMGAKGLMQVIPEQHQEKFAPHGGDEAVLDPATNILVGARILKDCIRRAGNIESGLQLYAGAYGDSSNQYAQKVLAEKERISQVLRRSDRLLPRQGSVANPSRRTT